MNSNRRDFLKFTSLMGAASLLPARIADAGSKSAVASSAGACTLIPAEIAGPFPLDLTANSAFLRKDIRESKTGIPLNLKLKIFGVGNCMPMPNLRVNIWQCDKDGNYSGYDNQMNPGQAGLKYLRGYQVTDENGEVEFLTIFPGWYNGRICHIHFQVYVSSTYAAVSQLTFDVAAKNALYAANPALYTKGVDPTTVSGDSVFSDGYMAQVATLTANQSGGYDSYMEVSVQGSGTLGVGHLEKQNAKQFSLGQSFPNPLTGEITVPFTLKQRSDVTLDIRDLSGKLVASVSGKGMDAGAHGLKISQSHLGRMPANFLYQLEVTNASGRFTEFRRMTSFRP